MKLLIFTAAIAAQTIAAAQSPWEKEVVYQIFPRSFYSSAGNHIGDMKGIEQKLGFLHQLGVTAILINPIFDSRLYHNYFADDFLKVDPTMGSNQDFFAMVAKAHGLHMKVILDMEVQYVADRHPWYTAVAKNPKSPIADHLWREGSAFFGSKNHWYDRREVNFTSINPDNPDVKKTILNVFRYWAAPDGKPSHGVDGYRIDHMMDDLDNKHLKTGMLQHFWLPIEQSVRSLNPKIMFLAEQADWGLGTDMFTKAKVDSVYAIPLRFLFMTFDRQKIEREMLETAKATPPGKTQFVFIENHDLERYATAVHSDPALLRLGAVFNLTIKGTPLIYYGQELGMRGTKGNWNSDGNDIPMRLAYRWSHVIGAKGTADFYRNTGPWTQTGASKDNDGISVEEESGAPGSLFNFYKRLIRLRETHAALETGSEEIVNTNNPSVLGFDRILRSQKVRVLLNLSKDIQTVSLPSILSVDLWTGEPVKAGTVRLSPHSFAIFGEG